MRLARPNARPRRDAIIYAFEPNPVMFKRIANNISLNPALEHRIVPQETALGDKSGTISINVPRRNTGAGSIVRNYDAEPSDKFNVAMTTIDEFVEAQALERIDFIKIDVEGFEPLVFQGGMRTMKNMRPDLYIEQGQGQNAPVGAPESFIYDFLRNLNYAISVDVDGVRPNVTEFDELRGLRLYNLAAKAASA